MRKFYIQPQTDLVRTANGEPVMAPIGEGLAGSGTAGQPGGAAARLVGTTVGASSAARVLYI